MTLALIDRKDASDGLSFEADAELVQAQRQAVADALNELKQDFAEAFHAWRLRNGVHLKGENVWPDWCKSPCDTQDGRAEYRLGLLNDWLDDMSAGIEL